MVDINSDKFKACVNIVISQTDYDEKKATEKLIEFNEDFIKVIKHYLNPDFDKKKTESTIKKNQMNQEIIKQIRKFKDKQDSTYLSKKENVEKMKKLYELHLSKKNEA